MEEMEVYDQEIILENVKLKLSIDVEDTKQDALLGILYKDAYDYMIIYFDGKVPLELRFILENVIVKRYRKLGAEGITIEKIDVLSTTYESGDDFAEYFDIMQYYKNKYYDQTSGDSKKKKPRLGFRFF
jgi:hypothetical protein